MALPLIINVNDPDQNGRLSSFDSGGQAIEQEFIRGDINLALSIRPVEASTTGERPWDDDWLVDDTFQVAIGNPDQPPTGGTFDLAALSSAITSSSVANPSVITHAASAVTLATGGTVYIVGHSGSVPDINGKHVVTVSDSTHFTIPVNVTTGGTGGNAYLASTGLTGLEFDISAADLATALTVAPLAAPTVTLQSTGVYEARWGLGLDAPDLVSPDSFLSPNSFVNITDDSTDEVEVRIISLKQQPVAYAEPSTPFPSAGVTSTVKQSGSGSANKIYAISFNAPGTYGGSYSLNYTDVASATKTAGVFTPTSTPEAIQAALENLTAVGDFSVSQDSSGVVTIEMKGTQKLSNTPVIAVTNINLLAPLGVTGTIALNTTNLYRAFWAVPITTTELQFTLEIRRSRASGEQAAIYQHQAILKRNLIDGVIVPTTLASYYTEAQSDARFLNSATAQSANTAFGNFTGSPAAPTFASDATVRSSLSLAKSGVNSDITELNAIGLIVTADSITAANETVDALRITAATDGKAGSFTLVAGVAVVGNSNVTVASVIIVTASSVSGTRAGNPDIVINSGVGFTATGGTLDASDYNYIVFDIS